MRDDSARLRDILEACDLLSHDRDAQPARARILRHRRQRDRSGRRSGRSWNRSADRPDPRAAFLDGLHGVEGHQIAAGQPVSAVWRLNASGWLLVVRMACWRVTLPLLKRALSLDRLVRLVASPRQRRRDPAHEELIVRDRRAAVAVGTRAVPRAEPRRSTGSSVSPARRRSSRSESQRRTAR